MPKAPERKARWSDIGLGHIIVLIGWGVSIVWGYSSLNSRVSVLEQSVFELRKDWKEASEKLLINNTAIATQVSFVNNKLSTIENDVAWIKKNVK